MSHLEKELYLILQHNLINEKFHYPLICYKVELFGSWNNWNYGTVANMEYEISRNNGKLSRIIKYVAKINLKKGKYEYKWKFSYFDKNNNAKNHIIWLTDDNNKLEDNDGWNKNNILTIP